MSTPLLNWQRVRLLVLLFVVLASIYMITYSARVESGDTRRSLNAVGSLVNYGDYDLDLATIEFIPQVFDKHQFYPLQTANVEPLQVFLAAPLYLLARAVPGIGLIRDSLSVQCVGECGIWMRALSVWTGTRLQ